MAVRNPHIVTYTSPDPNDLLPRGKLVDIWRWRKAVDWKTPLISMFWNGRSEATSFARNKRKEQSYGQRANYLCPGSQQASNNRGLLVLLTWSTPTDYRDPIDAALLRQPQDILNTVIGRVSHCNLDVDSRWCLRCTAYLLLISVVISSRQLLDSADDLAWQLRRRVDEGDLIIFGNNKPIEEDDRTIPRKFDHRSFSGF